MGLSPSQKKKFLAAERDHQLAIAALHEFGSVARMFVSNPVGLWLTGKMILKGVADPLQIGDEPTRTGINQLFDALAIANAAVSVTGQALPLLTAIQAGTMAATGV